MSDEKDPVVLALRTAIAAGDSADLRVALGDHLRKKGQPGAALAEYEAAIRLVPASGVALEGAAAAAAEAGDGGRAAGYRAAAAAAAKSANGGNGGGNGHSHPAPSPAAAASSRDLHREEEIPELTLADVGGMDDVKARLNRSFVLPLRNPDVYARYGKRIGGGLILYGPPGCGKTYIARALAGEVGARFTSFGLFDLIEDGPRRLHERFQNARRRAPNLVFFDEFDAVGQRRVQLRNAAWMRTIVNQLLSELDGFEERNDGVFFLCATNHPWDIDPALRRPGRFDKMVFVAPPDATARERILALALTGRPLGPIDLKKLAAKTEGYSGADLVAIVETATEMAIEATLEGGGKDLPVDEALLLRAIADVKPSTRPWFETARNFAVYANEGGVYDELLGHLKKIGLG